MSMLALDATADESPYLVFVDGADTLQLEEGGKVYLPGDRMPKSLSRTRRAALQATGIRFVTVHPEPVLTPEGEPATIAAAQQIEPPPGGPAVVAAVEDVPKGEGVPIVLATDVPVTNNEQPAPRASRRG